MNYRTTSIDEIFIKVKNLSETMYSELWDGRLRESEERGLLIKTVAPLKKDSQGENLFKVVLERFIATQSEELLASGIDGVGYGYLILKFKGNSVLKEIGLEYSINERLGYLIQFLQLVSDFHSDGIICGDISVESIRRTANSIMFFGFLGSCFEEIKLLSSAKVGLKKYLAPEIAMGGNVSISSDVYAIGVLGYIICCGAKSISDEMAEGGHFLRSNLAPSQVDNSISSWVDDILGNCLQFDPKKRTKDSLEILSQIESSIRQQPLNIPRVQWFSNELMVVAQEQKKSTKKVLGNEVGNPVSKNENESQKSTKTRNFKISGRALKIILGTCVLGIFAALIAVLVSGKAMNFSKKEQPQDIAKISNLIEQEKLETHFEKFLAQDQPPEEKLKLLQSIVKKNIKIDQALFNYLEKNLRTLPDGYAKVISETIIFWVDKYGYQKIKIEIQKRLDSRVFEQAPSRFAEIANLILNVIDPNTADQERVASLRLIYQKDQSFSLVFAALLSEESSQAIFFPVFRDFLSGRGFSQLPKDATRRALYLLSDETRALLGEDRIKLLEESSNEDLRMVADALLLNSLRVDLEFIKQTLSIITKRSDIGKFANVFIEVGQREVIFGKPESIVLYKLTLGTVKGNDLLTFMEWNNPDWEKIMYATLATNKNPEVLDRAFDIISRRGATNPVIKKLFEYLKKNFWEQKNKFAYSIGVFALKDMATNEDLDLAFEKMLLLSNGSLFTTLISTGDPYFIEQAAERIAPIAKLSEITPLLSNDNPRVRIAGIRALAGKNDINTLQTILANYRKEKNPDVIKVYNEIHWVTKNRDLPRNNSTSPQ